MKYKRIYKETKNGKELLGYKSDKAYIEIYYYDITKDGNFHKDYVVNELKLIGKESRFSTLKDAKETIEKYL